MKMKVTRQGWVELSKHLSLGALQSMHKDAQSVYKTPIVHLIGKNIEGQLAMQCQHQAPE